MSTLALLCWRYHGQAMVAERDVEVDHVTITARYRGARQRVPAQRRQALQVKTTRPTWNWPATCRFRSQAIDRFGQSSTCTLLPARAAMVRRFSGRQSMRPRRHRLRSPTSRRRDICLLEDLLPALASQRPAGTTTPKLTTTGYARRQPRRPNARRSASVIIAAHALVPTFGADLDELAATEPANRRMAVAFHEPVSAPDGVGGRGCSMPWPPQRNSARQRVKHPR